MNDKSFSNLPTNVPVDETSNPPVDEKMECIITKDQLHCIVFFTPPSNNGKTLTIEDISNLLAKNNIVYGIDTQVLDSLKESRDYGYKYIIASGTPPVNGIDAKIETPFTTSATPQFIENEKGNIDFKNLGLIQNITKDTLLATKTPVIEGIEGTSVTGKSLPPWKARDIKLSRTKNTRLSEDGLSLYADTDGQLYIKDFFFDVMPLLVIEGDVDASTGNIDFVGTVIVQGSVKTGYAIKSKKTIEIKGGVEGATLEAGEDIILSYGIQGGGQGSLSAGRDIVAKFIENSRVSAKNDVIAETIVQSVVDAGNAISCIKGKGSIIGGTVLACTKISANIIGGTMEIPTRVKIGLPSETSERLKSLSLSQSKIQKEINDTSKNIDFLLKKQLLQKLSSDKKTLLHELVKKKILLETRFKEILKELSILNQQSLNANKGYVEILKKLYPAVTLSLGESKLTTRDKHTHCRIIHKNDQIQFTAL